MARRPRDPKLNDSLPGDADADRGRPKLRIKPLAWDEDGWPVVAP